MDIQTRKIQFVQEFLKLQNEDLLVRLEKLLLSNKSQKKENKKFTPMSINELNQRISKSMNDSKNNKLTSTKDLITEIEKWS